MSTALAPVKESLWKLEEDVDALLNSADLVDSDEDKAALQADLTIALERAVTKRDQVAAWIGREESSIAAINGEITRLEALRKARQRSIYKVEEYVLNVILSKGPDAKGKFSRLEGETSRFSACKNPASVEITDAVKVPEEYCAVTLSFAGWEWIDLADSLDMEVYSKLVAHIKDRSPNKTLLKAKLQAGEVISGAELAPTKYRLVRE
jgi:Siphovirus Gp157